MIHFSKELRKKTCGPAYGDGINRIRAIEEDQYHLQLTHEGELMVLGMLRA